MTGLGLGGVEIRTRGQGEDGRREGGSEELYECVGHGSLFW